MATAYLLAVSTRRPALDLANQTPADAESTRVALEAILPGRTLVHVRSGPWDSVWSEEGEICAILVGETLLIPGTEAEDVTPADGQGTWAYTYQSTSMVHALEVHSGEWDRELLLDGGWSTAETLAYATGTPLPPEEPYWAGEHDEDDDPRSLPFDISALADDCLRWMFGGPLADPVGDDVRLWQLPMHLFTITEAASTQRPAAVTERHTPERQSGAEPQGATKRRWWRR